MRHSVAGDMAHEWEKRDMEDIMMELEVLINSLEIDMPKFESYQKTLDGTHRISSDLYDLLGSSHHNQTLVARFRLGCFIYHQLLYVEKLGVNYET